MNSKSTDATNPILPLDFWLINTGTKIFFLQSDTSILFIIAEPFIYKYVMQ